MQRQVKMLVLHANHGVAHYRTLCAMCDSCCAVFAYTRAHCVHVRRIWHDRRLMRRLVRRFKCGIFWSTWLFLRQTYMVQSEPPTQGLELCVLASV